MKIRLVILVALLLIGRISFATDDGMSNYRLGAGDTISIIVYDEKELSLEKAKLSDAGSISYPMLGEIRVLGLTVSDLQKMVTTGLKDTYLINPIVTVSIDQHRDVFINGQVNKPGNYPYQPGLTVGKLVTTAGGFTDRAFLEAGSILHENNDISIPIKGKLSTLVEPGDTIIIEQYLDVYVNGQVHKPGNYPYQPGLTVRKIISTAGGFKDRASKEVVSIVHEEQSTPAPIKGKLDTLIKPGDTITVEESFF